MPTCNIRSSLKWVLSSVNSMLQNIFPLSLDFHHILLKNLEARNKPVHPKQHVTVILYITRMETRSVLIQFYWVCIGLSFHEYRFGWWSATWLVYMYVNIVNWVIRCLDGLREKACRGFGLVLFQEIQYEFICLIGLKSRPWAVC